MERDGSVIEVAVDMVSDDEAITPKIHAGHYIFYILVAPKRPVAR